MAHFSFKKELWKTNDPQWKTERELKWVSVERIRASQRANKVQLASLKKYFMKGEWSSDTKYAPRGGALFLYSPEHSVNIYDAMLACCKTQIDVQVFRSGVFGTLTSEMFCMLTTLNEEEQYKLVKHILNGQEEYVEERVMINGYDEPVFPEKLSSSINGFFWYYLKTIESLLLNKFNENTISHSLQLNLWASSLGYLDRWGFSEDFDQKYLLKILTPIAHYIPDHPSNPAASAKLAFVKQFKQYADEIGFANELVAQTWGMAKDNKEEEWLDDIYECSLENDPDQWDSYGFAAYTPLICRTNQNVNDLAAKISAIYCKNGLSHRQHLTIPLVDITNLLSDEFIGELPIDNRMQVYAELVRITLTDKCMGTGREHFSLDVLTLVNLPEKTQEDIPRLIIIERPKDHYQPDLARRYCANRQYMVDDIKAETGFQLVRYFGFNHNPDFDRTYPPRPQDYLEYQKEMQLPFYNAAYLPLKTGTTAFILNDENEYVVVPDRPTITLMNDGE